MIGILNRTTDSFYDKGSYYDLDRFFERAEQLVSEGADVLDVGGVKAGPGPEVSESEELDRVVPAIAALHERFEIPLSVDTWRASVAACAFEAGAVLGNDISGFADPEYLPVAARAGASVVATHIRLSPRVSDPEPHYDDLLAEVEAFLLARAERALADGIPADRVVLDAGLDLGKTAAQSLVLLQELVEARLARLPAALVRLQQDLPRHVARSRHRRAREASLAAAALGIAGGCRLLRVHEVGPTCKVRDLLAAILESAPAASEALAGDR